MFETKKRSYQNTVISLIFKYYLRNIQFEHYSQQPSNHQKSDFLTSYKNYMYVIPSKYRYEIFKPSDEKNICKWFLLLFSIANMYLTETNCNKTAIFRSNENMNLTWQ